MYSPFCFLLLFSPTNANLIYTFQPIFTALFAWTFLGETMGPAGFVGGFIIGSSVYLVVSANPADGGDGWDTSLRTKDSAAEAILAVEAGTDSKLELKTSITLLDDSDQVKDCLDNVPSVQTVPVENDVR
jgi:hypothetical protein